MNSNQKGKRLERECAKLINVKLDADCRRTPNSGALDFKGDICSIKQDCIAGEYSWECKNQESLNIWQALKQARDDVRIGSRKTPVVVFTRAHEQIYAAVTFNHFLDLLSELQELRKTTNIASD